MRKKEKETQVPTEETLEAEDRESRPGRGASVTYIVTSVILALAVALCLFIGIQVATRGYVDVAGYSAFRVVTGSMEPAIRVGETILSHKTPPSELRVGDIVCFRTSIAEIRGSIVTHRIRGIYLGEDGLYYLETQGDANLAADPFLVPETELVGRVVWTSGGENLLTDLLSFLTGKIGFLALIVLPVTLIAGLIVQNAVKGLTEELRTVRRELREEDELDALLPGYTTLTRRDYQEIYETLRSELLEELKKHDVR